MKIKKLHLKNFRLFRELDIEFTDDHLTVLIGGNGSGKSAVLDAIAIWLAQFIALSTVEDPMYDGESEFEQGDINAEADKSEIKILTSYESSKLSFDNLKLELGLTRDTLEGLHSLPLVSYTTQMQAIKTSKVDGHIPVIVFYRINRSSFNNRIDKKEKIKYVNPLFFSYNNALSQSISSFKDFSQWFIAQENKENEQKVHQEDLKYRLPSLEVVRTAIEKLVSSFTNANFGKVRVERRGGARLSSFQAVNINDSFVVIEKLGTYIPLSSLSSGEKSILLLVADIARRLCIANPKGEPLQGNGIVLIDEVELHLHPAWQRTILKSLREIFPNIQFIVTTHSPQVLSTVRDENLLVVGDGQVYSAADPYGRDTNAILDEIMGTPERPAEAEDLLKNIFALLAEKQVDFAVVESKIDRLKNFVTSEDPVFLRLANIIKRKQLIAAS